MGGMSSVRFSSAFVGVLLIGMSVTGYAQGGYIGVGVGTAKSSFDTESVEFFSGPNFTVDEKDSSKKFFAGYQFNRNASVEAAYVDLGEATATAPGPGDTYAAEVSGFELAALFSHPVGQRSAVFAKAGFFVWDSDVTVCLGGVGCGTGSESGTELALGLGAQFSLAKSFGIRAEYTMYDIDKVEAGTGDFKVISVSGVFSF